jgi:hypothetical protein
MDFTMTCPLALCRRHPPLGACAANCIHIDIRIQERICWDDGHGLPGPRDARCLPEPYLLVTNVRR